eukprot:TRINITY_DN14546_c0_g1_i1.p1 TRINITY_DN14546_c0_g1~~TRINITY_DN14546_c0_g1_i1.p1  ORF type:complete len:378 (-),score=90.14 TRINITY_DN14546_c0_g1_i1:169-1302(-)
MSEIQSFCEMTNTSREVAIHYLEQTGYDVEAAVLMYFDDPSGPSKAASAPSHNPPRANILPVNPSASTSNPVRSTSVASSTSTKKPTTQGPRIQTFSSMRSSDSQDESQPHNLYTGGTSSGLSVEGGPKKPVSSSEFRDDSFARMKQRADEEGDDEYAEVTQQKPSWFSGFGNLLGSTPQQSQKVAGDAPPPKNVKKTIFLWSNGFSIDDGPLRTLEDPVNRAFIQEIAQGYIPQELTKEAVNEKVAVSIEDRRQEPYVPPAKPKVAAFTGSGQKLTDSKPAPVIPKVAVSGGKIVVDDSQPTANIQIRMSDGSRLVVKVNHTHTVGDIYAHVASLPNAGKTFSLANTYPRKVLTEMGQTVSEAGLVGASLQHSITQ